VNMVNGSHKSETFRYSQNQRRKELKVKIYRKRRSIDRLQAELGGLPVQMIEDTLSEHNYKSCNYNDSIRSIHTKNIANSRLQAYYEKELFRKLKWFSFINQQKSKANLVTNFSKKLGDKSDVVLCFGDWEQKKHIKYKEPTMGKGIRNIFRTVGYSCFLVDEFGTSKYNFLTGEENQKFRKRSNPRPRKTNIRLQHGLLRSQNVLNNEPAQHMLVNRDLNGSMNIRLKAYNTIHNLPIPDYLIR